MTNMTYQMAKQIEFTEISMFFAFLLS